MRFAKVLGLSAVAVALGTGIWPARRVPLFGSDASAARAQGIGGAPPWRFGFEYNELFSPSVTPAQHATLLDKIASVTASQGTLGGINVNSIGGGWSTMQATPASAISFAEADPPVATITAKGFSVVWNWRADAQWAMVGNTDCIDSLGPDDCAPDAAHEQAWKDYVKAVVERYDGDGIDDMPGLTIPIEFYVMDQEIVFDGNEGDGDYGEARGSGFWDDSIAHLIRLHELTYQALREADPSGFSKLVGSGAILFDLYSDFADYPSPNPGPGSTIQARLDGANPRGSIYTEGFRQTVELLQALGDDSGGVKCDYIEWHPHSGWRAIDQSLALIKQYAPNKPIFVDDMWVNMLVSARPLDGWTQFLGGALVEGDFPNPTVPSIDALQDGLRAGNAAVTNWYNAKGARGAVKSFVTALGAGAERVSFSGTNDPCNILVFACLDQQSVFTSVGYLNLLGTRPFNYPAKPAYYTMKLLVDRLHAMTAVTRLPVSGNPLTRLYRFDRPSGGPVFVGWSETGPVPSDPSVPNGEVVTIPVGSPTAKLTRIVSAPGQTAPVTQTILAPGNGVTTQLGFEPIFLEPI